MIPDYVQECMKSPTLAVAASRDAQFTPYAIRVFGTSVHPNKTTMTFYIAECHSSQMIKNAENNGRLALTIEVPGEKNDSYQLKGKFVAWRKGTEEDERYLDEYQRKMYAFALQMGYPEEVLSKYNMLIYKPSVAISFDVESVFGQAPHPETGKQIC